MKITTDLKPVSVCDLTAFGLKTTNLKGTNTFFILLLFTVHCSLFTDCLHILSDPPPFTCACPLNLGPALFNRGSFMFFYHKNQIALNFSNYCSLFTVHCFISSYTVMPAPFIGACPFSSGELRTLLCLFTKTTDDENYH